jgi:peroxiredoxin
MLETLELGPRIDSIAPDFMLKDHENHPRELTSLIGKKGLLLGFIGDIWMPTSVRRIFWLQRHAPRFALAGAPVALLVRDDPHTLYGFRMSSPLPVPFPLLADGNGEMHQRYNMERHPGLVLLDSNLLIQAKWLMPDERVWPKMQELLTKINYMNG